MKTKTLLRISMILGIPAIFSLLANSMVSLMYLNHTEMKILNHEAISWFGFVGLFCGAWIITSMISVCRYADEIDELDKERDKYIAAKEEMEKVRDEFVELLKNKEK